MKHIAFATFRTLSVVVAGTILGVVVLVAWLLGTPQGATWAVAHLNDFIGLDIRAGKISGRAVGPIEVEDLHLHFPDVDIVVDRARVVWTPLGLLDRDVRVDSLEGGTVTILVHSTPPTGPHHGPSYPHIPVGIVVGKARLKELRLQLAPDQPMQGIADVSLDDGRWAGDLFKVARLSGDYPLTGPFEVSADADLHEFVADIRSLAAKLTGDDGTEVSISGKAHVDDGPSDLDVAWKNLRWPLRLDEPPIAASREGSLKVTGTFADAKAEGILALGDTATVSGNVRWAKEALEGHLSWTKLAWPLTGPARVASEQGTIDVAGMPQAYRYRLDGSLTAEGYSGDAKASGHGTLDDVTLETLDLAVGRASVEGSAHVAWNPDVTIDADVAVANVDPALFAPAWPGSLNGRVKAVTSVRGSEPHSDFTIALDRSQLRERPFALDAAGTLENSQVTLASFELRAGESKIVGKGRVTPPFDVSAQLDSPDLVALWPGLGGEASVHADFKGTLEAPHANVVGATERLAYAGVVVESASFNADIDVSGPWRADVDVSGVTGPVQLIRAKASLGGNAQAHDIQARVEAPQGVVDLAAHGALDFRQLQWKGSVTSGRIALGELTPWTLEDAAALSASRERVATEPACWRNGESRACGQVTHEGPRLRTAFRLEKIDFGWFAPLLPSDWTVAGGLSGTGVVQLDDGRLTDARADVALAPTSVSREGETLLQTQEGAIHVSQDGGRILADASLPMQGGSIDANATIGDAADPLQRPLVARLEVRLDDLGFIRVASPEIDSASGHIEGTLAWTGTTGAPRANGSIALTDGRFKLGRPGITLEKVTATLTGVGNRAVDVDASATSDDGVLTVKGRTETSEEGSNFSLAVKGDRFRVANTTEVRAWVSPDLVVALQGRKLDVTGSVTVPKAEITPVTFDSGIAPSSDQRIVQKGGEADQAGGLVVSADVNLVLGEKIHFEGFGLKTDLEGRVRAIEQPGRPGSGRGEVRLEGGRYKAYGQDLEIESGRLLFNGGPLTEPGVDIRAVRKPTDDIEIDVLVRGTLAKPVFQLSSVPAMPRERQLSWLVLGRDLESTTGSGDERSMLANAALSLGLTGTDFLANTVRGRLGLDEISIGSQPGEESDQARFTIGKYLSPKLYVSYGVGIFQPGNVFKLLYDLGHGFKLSTESGVQTGGDLLYSVETGKPKKSAAKAAPAPAAQELGPPSAGSGG